MTDLSSQRTLVDIAQTLAARVQELTSALQAKGLPLPSFDAAAPSPDFLPAEDRDLQALRNQLVSDAKLIADIFTGPRKHLVEMACFGNHQAMAMRVLYNFDIASHVPLAGTISYPDLSRACGLDEQRLTRIVRYLIIDHVLIEPSPGQVAHSATSKLLATEEMSIDFLGHQTEEIFPACVAQSAALRKAPFSTEPLDCGAVMALGEGKRAMFDLFSTEPERMRRFGGAMQFYTSPGSHTSADSLLANFDWAGQGAAKVVDVGGSFGHNAMRILESAPDLSNIVVQDLPDVVAEAQVKLVSSELDERLEFQAASFFDPQPVVDADIYLYCNVFVDWPEEKVVEMLKMLVPSMKLGSKLVVHEPLIGVPGEQDSHSAKFSRMMDMQMMVGLNAFVKSPVDWGKIARLGSGNRLRLEEYKDSVIVFAKA